MRHFLQELCLAPSCESDSMSLDKFNSNEIRGGFTMDSLGRRKTIMIGAMINLVGAVLQSSAQNLAMVLVGRILAGWAVGVLSMSVPVYQSECAHPKTRGMLMFIFFSIRMGLMNNRFDCWYRPANDRRRFHRLYLGWLRILKSPGY
jgi:hypothetical protein